MKVLKRMKFALPVAGFGFRTFLVAVLVLWLVATVTGYVAAIIRETTDEPWLTGSIEMLAYLSAGLLGLLILWGVWSGAVRLARATVPGLLATDSVEMDFNAPAGVEEAPEIREAVRGLSQVLVELETDSGRASLLLLDASQYAANLVALIKAISLKAEEMRREAESLQAAVDAVASRDPVRIATAAGRVQDAHIRELMLCDVTTADYWAGVTRLIATQLGTLEQWSAGYDRFTTNLLTEVSSCKARLAALTASLDLVGTARPLLQLQENLDLAKGALQPQRRSELGTVLKSLPAIEAGGLGR